jgi:hypothetical protein
MTFKHRQDEITRKIAIAALRQPLLSSGLWFHHDIRDNFYYASYLFAAAVDAPEQLPFDRDAARQTAAAVLLAVLRLQDQNTTSDTYGHWPLGLGNNPQEAKPHPLPVELMGSLMAFFASRYRTHFDEILAGAFDSALLHAYRGGFYLQENTFGHHDAKYTAAKLIFGQRFADTELIEDGRSSLQLTLAHVRKQGMSEYGSLPWFWHWVQAFTCAWHLTEDPSINKELAEMLDYLWGERAVFYLKGAWVGAHCRGQKHDIPLDSNVLHDYVQFGDFELPSDMPRTEYAGFLYYKAPDSALETALNRTEAAEVKKVIKKLSKEGEAILHSYAYITAEFAAGGVWERYEEFDNEQQRWDFSLPLGTQSGVNQAYFFHPSETNAIEDPRHQTGETDVLFHQNTIVALYPLPDEASPTILGVLPLANWHQDTNLLLGQTGNVYWAVYLMKPYTLELLSDRCLIKSEGRQNGVVIEAISLSDAQRRGISSFSAFQEEARNNIPAWSAEAKLSVRYKAFNGSVLQMDAHVSSTGGRWINGQAVDFSDYTL